MLEHINLAILLMGILAFFAVGLSTLLAMGKAQTQNRSSKSPYIGFTIMTLIVIGVLLDGYTTKTTIEENITLFQEDKELRCAATFEGVYLVSKQEGWRLSQEAFVKDSMLIDAQFCKERKK